MPWDWEFVWIENQSNLLDITELRNSLHVKNMNTRQDSITLNPSHSPTLHAFPKSALES